MAHPHGLQQLKQAITGAAIGTLTTRNTLLLNSSMVNIGRDFLLKNIRVLGQVTSMAAEEAIIIGFARGLASTAEINRAMNDEQTSPDDPSNLNISQEKSAVFWQAQAITNGDSAGNRKDWIDIDTRIGARGKGIPLFETDGIQAFAFNPTGSTMTTGALVDLDIRYSGVWLYG